MANGLQFLEPKSSEGREFEELEKLEADVNEMAQKILEYRATLPDLLINTLASIVASQRPLFVTTNSGFGSEPGSSGYPNPDAGGTIESGNNASLEEDEDQQTAKRTHLLRQKICSNISSMPVILKRIRKCLSRIEYRDSSNGNYPPAFRRKRIG